MKLLLKIKHRWNANVLFSLETTSLKLCVEAAVKSNADLRDAVLRGADLSGADLSGADLSDADLSGADLSDAVLRGADLSDADLIGANLSDADLSDADLRGANLSDADLIGANLSGAVLRGAVLSGADLSGADLSGADLRGAVLKKLKVEDLDGKILKSIEAHKATNGFDMGNWHGGKEDCDETNWCQTTHCRAGYAICMAGKAGFDLEKKVGPATAGILIYAASYPKLPIPNFYCDNDTALADIKARAKLAK